MFRTIQNQSTTWYEITDEISKLISVSIVGLKIVIFNQTDVAETSLSGVNVPAGHSMDIPFKMQHVSTHKHI